MIRQRSILSSGKIKSKIQPAVLHYICCWLDQFTFNYVALNYYIVKCLFILLVQLLQQDVIFLRSSWAMLSYSSTILSIGLKVQLKLNPEHCSLKIFCIVLYSLKVSIASTETPSASAILISLSSSLVSDFSIFEMAWRVFLR